MSSKLLYPIFLLMNTQILFCAAKNEKSNQPTKGIECEQTLAERRGMGHLILKMHELLRANKIKSEVPQKAKTSSHIKQKNNNSN